MPTASAQDLHLVQKCCLRYHRHGLGGILREKEMMGETRTGEKGSGWSDEMKSMSDETLKEYRRAFIQPNDAMSKIEQL